MATVPAAPTVRRFAREVGADITSVQGSGPGGRISIDDVKAHTHKLLSQGGRAASGAVATAELPDLSRFGPIRREAMSKVRRLTAENLTRAWLNAPQVTNHEQADITDLEEFRKAYKGRVEEAGGKLTMTAILVKIVASTLKQHPTLNAAVDMANHEIVYRESINIGVAVDTERGLLVPVIRDADGKNLTEIGVALDDLARRARDKKLSPDDLQGGTFSISNLGGIGGTGILPHRQLARGRDSRRVARPHRTAVARGLLPSAADAAAVAVLRPPPGRRRGRRPFPGASQGLARTTAAARIRGVTQT